MRSLWIAGTVLVTLLIVVGCQEPFRGDPTMTITGTITLERADDSVTMAGIRVVERGITEHPAEDGTFIISGLTAGDYVVEVVAPGYVPITREVSASDGGEYPLGELELLASDAIYVSTDGHDSNNGLSGDTRVSSLHSALRLAKFHGLTSIKVAGGTYDLDGDTLLIDSPVGITGGYNASNWDQQDPGSYETVITGATDAITIGAVSGALVQDVTLRPIQATEDGYSRGFNIYGSNAWIIGVSVEPENVEFFQFEAMGIFHGSSVEVIDSYLQVPDTQDHANGIHPMYGSYVRLNNTELVVGYAGHESGAFGIHVTENSMAELYDSSITMTPSVEQSIGIFAEDSAHVLVEESSVESGDSSEDASYGIELYQNASATIENSSVYGGASDLESAGILVGGVATASILGNDFMMGGPLASDDVPDSQSAGIIVRSISGAVRIVDNNEISGPSGAPVDTEPSARPDRTFGVLIEERANAVIADNATISGGLARQRATGIGGWGFSGAVEIQDNGIITAGEVTDPGTDRSTATQGISFGTDDPTAYVRIIGNHVDGGVVERPADTYGDSTGVSLYGSFSATIVENLIDGGSVENTGDFGSGSSPEYYGGPTAVNPGAASVYVSRNDLRVIDPVPPDAADGGKVFVRAIHGGAPGGEVIATNNQVLTYNVDAPIHVFEAQNHSNYTVTNNTVIAQVNDDASDSYTSDEIGPWVSHTGSSIRLTNNLWYFPNGLNNTLADSGLADPEIFAYNHVLAFDGVTNPVGDDHGWSDNTLIASEDTDPAAYWVTPDADLSDGFSGDLSLKSSAPVINQGLIANTPQLGYVADDFHGNERQPSAAVEDGGSDTMIDIGAFEYVGD